MILPIKFFVHFVVHYLSKILKNIFLILEHPIKKTSALYFRLDAKDNWQLFHEVIKKINKIIFREMQI